MLSRFTGAAGSVTFLRPRSTSVPGIARGSCRGPSTVGVEVRPGGKTGGFAAAGASNPNPGARRSLSLIVRSSRRLVRSRVGLSAATSASR